MENDMVLSQIDEDDDSQEEYGWKLVHGDVFRSPRNSMLLSVMVGSGIQVFSMALITLGNYNKCLSYWLIDNRCLSYYI